MRGKQRKLWEQKRSSLGDFLEEVTSDLNTKKKIRDSHVKEEGMRLDLKGKGPPCVSV